MCVSQHWTAVVVVACLLLCSCSGRDYGKETFPVTGEIYVDGSPGAEVSITLHDVKGMDATVPTVSATFSKADGTFAISTFEEGDGVPAGDYIATFEWGTFNPISRGYENDKFKGKYKDPTKSEHKVTVTAGAPASMGRIELTTK